MKTLTVTEYEKVFIGETFSLEAKTFSENQVAFLEAALASYPKDIVQWGRNSFSMQQYVGVIAFQDCTLEVLPKIDGVSEAVQIRGNLLKMLSEAYDLPLYPGELSGLSRQRMNVLEIYIALYCSHLLKEAQRGLIHKYQREEQNIPYCKGKLLSSRQLRENLLHPERFYCSYDEFNANHILNALLKAALRVSLRISKVSENQRKIRQLLFLFDEVDDQTFSVSTLANINTDRTTSRFQPLVEMAKTIVQAHSPDVSTGGHAAYTMLFDMNKLFEEYIARCISRYFYRKESYSIKTQGPQLYLAQETDSLKPRFKLKPDITVLRNNVPVCILDTKWKLLDSKEAKLGISQGDIYQMLAYSSRYNTDENILLYPHHRNLSPLAGSMKTYKLLQSINSNYSLIKIATVDLSNLSSIPEQIGKILADTYTQRYVQ